MTTGDSEIGGPPATLYHYTSPAGLAGILSKRTVWATLLHHMSDAREFRHAISVAMNIVGKRASGKKKKRQSFCNNLGSGLMSAKGTRICAFSLSGNGNLLSQWRAYCPQEGGYSIGFDTIKFQTVLSSLNFALVACVYDPGKQEQLLGGLIDRTLEKYARLIGGTKPPPTPSELGKLVSQFVLEFKLIAPIIKPQHFPKNKSGGLCPLLFRL